MSGISATDLTVTGPQLKVLTAIKAGWTLRRASNGMAWLDRCKKGAGYQQQVLNARTVNALERLGLIRFRQWVDNRRADLTLEGRSIVGAFA